MNAEKQHKRSPSAQGWCEPISAEEQHELDMFQKRLGEKRTAKTKLRPNYTKRWLNQVKTRLNQMSRTRSKEPA